MKRLLFLSLTPVLAWAQYTYYFVDSFWTINSTHWQANGVISGSGAGLISSDSAGGSVISKVAVPGGLAAYEVKTKVRLNRVGGTYVQYLRASPDAKTGPDPSGAFYSLEWTNVLLTPDGGCAFDLRIKQRVNGLFTELAAYNVGCIGAADNYLVAVINAAGHILTRINDVGFGWLDTGNTITSGQPGVGLLASPAGNSIVETSLGPADITAPSPIDTGRASVQALPNRIDIEWESPNDGVSGTGVGTFLLYRNGVWFGSSFGTLSDATVSPNGSYTYMIVPCDRHANCGPGVNIQVTTPPAGTLDARRVGVRADGAYWGGPGENIDAFSGNLSFNIPLLTAIGRSGLSLGLSLSYNSQMWRGDGAGTSSKVWKIGRDVGYGQNWILTPGSIRPAVSEFWNVHHYTFTDPSGAEYRLDINNNGIWTSSEAFYARWDPGTRRLIWPDGTIWYYYCTALGGEPDQGTHYPTRIEDRNGNQILLEYQGAWGAGMPNSSARIAVIADLRAPAGVNKSYEFQYTTGQLPRLTKIKNYVNTGEEYSFTYAHNQPLWTPMAPVEQRGTTSLLTEVKVDRTGARWLFQYGSNQSAELTRVTLPLGGELQYEYQQRDYPNGRRLREVSVRRLKTTPSASPWTYTFSVIPGDVGQNSVRRRTLADPSGPVRRWSFVSAGGSETPFGRLKIYEEAADVTAANPMLRQEITWTQDAAGRWYAGTTLTKLDPGTANERVSKTEIVRDTFGNVTTQRVYDYGELSTPKRTYTYTYMTIGNARLPTLAQVTESGQTLSLASWQYDSLGLIDAPGMTYHNPLFNHYYAARGLPTVTYTLGRPPEYRWYDIGGNLVRYQREGAPLVNVTVNSASQWAAPSLVVPNSNTNLADSYQWNQYLLLTSAPAPTAPRRRTPTTSSAAPPASPRRTGPSPPTPTTTLPCRPRSPRPPTAAGSGPAWTGWAGRSASSAATARRWFRSPTPNTPPAPARPLGG